MRVITSLWALEFAGMALQLITSLYVVEFAGVAPQAAKPQLKLRRSRRNSLVLGCCTAVGQKPNAWGSVWPTNN